MSDDNYPDIQELKARYARYADDVFRSGGSATSATALADLFTSDGILDLGPFGRYEGRAELLNAFQNILPNGTAWSTHYIVSPLFSKTDDDNVTADWYFLIQSVPKTPAHAPVSPIYGGYADKYKKVGGAWKIKESVSR